MLPSPHSATVAAFARALAPRQVATDCPRLRDALMAAHAHAVADMPDVDFEARDFAAFLATKIKTDVDPVDALETLATSDLFLAGACAMGSRAAMAHLETGHLQPLRRVLARIGASGAVADDVLADLRAYLLSPDSPKIANYSGRGKLSRWIQIAAVRTYYKMQRSPREVLDEDLVAGFAAPTHDPEFDYFKALYQRDFKAAFARALAQLDKRDRNLLRHAILDGLTCDQIGRIYHVSRATAARHIAAAREAVVERTLELLRTEFGVPQQDLRSILRLLASQASSLSVRRLLQES